jgi:hypothetical protein
LPFSASSSSSAVASKRVKSAALILAIPSVVYEVEAADYTHGKGGNTVLRFTIPKRISVTDL